MRDRGVGCFEGNYKPENRGLDGENRKMAEEETRIPESAIDAAVKALEDFDYPNPDREKVEDALRDALPHLAAPAQLALGYIADGNASLVKNALLRANLTPPQQRARTWEASPFGAVEVDYNRP